MVAVDRAQQIAQLWSWLPAFRAVAETQHLPSAARAMHVTPSALSRSVALIEREVGIALFTRAGRGIQLAPAGAALLGATRDAMRRIDDALAQLRGRPTAPLRIATDAGWFGALVAPACADLGRAMEHVDVADARSGLLTGDVDLVIHETASTDPELDVRHLGDVAHALFVARGRRGDRRSDRHALCTSATDVWPLEAPRTIVLRSPRWEVVLEAVRGGAVAAVIPRCLGARAGLREVVAPVLRATPLLLSTRRPLAGASPDPLIAAIVARARDVLG